MARYFFHLCDGRDVLMDPDGREVEGASQIAALALKECRMCISQDAIDGRIDLGQSIEVRDDRGELIHALRFQDAVFIGRQKAEQQLDVGEGR